MWGFFGVGGWKLTISGVYVVTDSICKSLFCVLSSGPFTKTLTTKIQNLSLPYTHVSVAMARGTVRDRGEY
jgi:hypothetical protein